MMKTAFSFLHPAVSFFYYIGAAVLAMTLLHPVFLGAGLLLLLLLLLMQGSSRQVQQLLRSSVLLAVIIVVINPLFTHRGRTILFYLGDNPVTLEAILYGVTISCSFLLVSCLFASYNQTISSHQFLYMFSRFSPKAALLTMIAIRFVPLFLRRLSHITLVQRTKGVQVEEGALRLRMQNGMKLLAVLLVTSLEEALQTADSMQARGFGSVKRSTYIQYKLTVRDGVFGGIMLLLFLICMAGAGKGAGILTIYPKVQWTAFHIRDWIVCGAFLLYVSIPILIEGREWLWWRMQK